MEAIWERIRTSGIFSGAQAGQYITALTAIEIALWDLAGKALGLPIYQLMGGKMRDRIRVYMRLRHRRPQGSQAKPYIGQIVENGCTMAKIDIDEARDPARFDRVNWTANNAEIDHMVDKVAFMRESLPKAIELAVDMHGRYDLRHRQARGQGAGAFPAGLAGGTGAAGKHRRHARRARNRPTLPSAPARTSICAGASASCSRSRRRHHHAGHSEVRRTGGRQEDRQHGADLLRADRAALAGVAHWRDGDGPHAGDGAEFPGRGMALEPSGAIAGSVGRISSSRATSSERPYRGSRTGPASVDDERGDT